MSDHIIHRQLVSIKLAGQEPAQELQERVSSLFREELLARLSETFDGISTPDKIIRIDSLHVDLGVINTHNFEQEFSRRLIEEVEKVLTAGSKDADQYGTTVLSRPQSLRDAWTYFLEWGTLPWYKKAKSTDEWETDMLNKFSDSDWRYCMAWLREESGGKPVILERLTGQFSDTFIEKLLAVASAGLLEHSWKDMYDDLLSFAGWLQGAGKNNLRNLIWNCCLAAALQEQQTEAMMDSIARNLYQRLATDAAAPADLPGRLRQWNAKRFSGHPPVQSREDGPVQRNAKESEVLIFKTAAVCKALERLADQVEKKPYKALPKPHPDGERGKKIYFPGQQEARYVYNSGIILLHPFLDTYFSALGLMKESRFIDPGARKRAVFLLHYLATAETQVPEFDLTLQKILCNFSLEEPLPGTCELTDTEKEESEKLLVSVIGHWPPLRNTSPEGLRNTFLQREGKLLLKESGWLLTVEQKTVDILLDKLPWGYSTIRLPWMDTIFSVDWR